jgi:mRNA interferase MazF
MRRGEVWLGNLNPNRGAEIGKVRPVLIMQADFLIAQGELTIPQRDDLEQACQVMTEQPRTLDRQRLIKGPLTRLTPHEMLRVERSFKAVVGFYEPTS